MFILERGGGGGGGCLNNWMVQIIRLIMVLLTGKNGNHIRLVCVNQFGLSSP